MVYELFTDTGLEIDTSDSFSRMGNKLWDLYVSQSFRGRRTSRKNFTPVCRMLNGALHHRILSVSVYEAVEMWVFFDR